MSKEIFNKKIFALVLLVMSSSVGAQDRVIPRGQAFCLHDEAGEQYRGCTARKFSNDYFYQATCPNLLDPDAPASEHRITDKWSVVFEGEPGCEPIIADRSDIPYYAPRSLGLERIEDTEAAASDERDTSRS